MAATTEVALEPILIWFADLAANLAPLSPRLRAQALSLMADEVREAITTLTEKRYVSAWQINELLGVALLPVKRDWHGLKAVPIEDPYYRLIG